MKQPLIQSVGDIDQAVACITDKFSVVGILDLRNIDCPDWISIYQSAKELYKSQYNHLEKIILIMDCDWYDPRFECGIMLDGIQRIFNQIDISNYFVELLTTNQNISAEVAYLQDNVSTDTVPIQVSLCEGNFDRHMHDQISRYDKSKINTDSTLKLKPFYHDLLYQNSSFCMAPWTHLFVQTDQQVFPCCVSQTPVGDLKTSSLDQIWNSDKLKEIRSHMSQGRRHPACAGCYINEDANKTSYRHFINRKMSQHISKIDSTNDHGEIDKFELNYLHFKFSNLCNLACRSCGPAESSSWHAVALSTGDITKDIPILRTANKNGSLYQNFLQHTDHINLIKFTGGEPLIMQEFYDILDHLIETKRTDIELFYNTNLMQLEYRGRNVLDLWQKFPNLVVGASIDAVGDRGEYIRSFSKWTTVVKNAKKIKMQCPHVYFFVSPTVSILNVLHLPDLHRALIDQEIISPGDFDINTLVNPQDLSLLNAPRNLRELITESYNKHISWLQSIDKTGRSTGAFIGVINLVNHDNEFDQVAFWARINKLDKYHGTDLLTTFPELRILPKDQNLFH